MGEESDCEWLEGREEESGTGSGGKVSKSKGDRRDAFR